LVSPICLWWSSVNINYLATIISVRSVLVKKGNDLRIRIRIRAVQKIWFLLIWIRIRISARNNVDRDQDTAFQCDANEDPAVKTYLPVLRIHNILVWIRIRIHGSTSLTNGSGSWTRILIFSSLTSRCQPKTHFYFLFIYFKDKKSERVAK